MSSETDLDQHVLDRRTSLRPIASISGTSQTFWMRKVLPLHDAEFNGLTFEDESARLHFVRTDGKPYVVELLAVDAMQMDDFRQGNIVVLFELLSGDVHWDTVAWDRLYPAPHPSAASKYHQTYDAFLQSKRIRIANGDLILVNMVPALGADLVAVCEGVKTAEG